MFIYILVSEKYNACNCNLFIMAMSLTRKSHFIFLLSCPWSWLWLLCSSELLRPAVPKPMAFHVQTPALRSLLQLYPWHMVSCYKNFYTFLLLNSFSWLKHTLPKVFIVYPVEKIFSFLSESQDDNHVSKQQLFLIYSNIIVQCIFWFILLKHFRDRP